MPDVPAPETLPRDRGACRPTCRCSRSGATSSCGRATGSTTGTHRPPGEFHEQRLVPLPPDGDVRRSVPRRGALRCSSSTPCCGPSPIACHPENTDCYAPSVDVQVRFHALAPDDECLLADAHSPAARDGLVGGVGVDLVAVRSAARDRRPADALPARCTSTRTRSSERGRRSVADRRRDAVI